MVAGGVAFVAHRAASLPAEMAREGQKALADLRSVAAAFRTGTITTTFAHESTALAGASRLQFATLRQVEVFSRRDQQSLLWGRFPLPDVVVEARAPVEYTYTLDLEKPWTFRLEGETLRVEAPAIEWNTPAIDASALRYEVREDSVLRDEAAVLEALRASLTQATRLRARDNVALVRETGRVKAGEFVTTWLKGRFDDAKDLRVVVVFADEPRQLATPPPR